uniref:Uncharacterized protein n=1 Tax=Tetradesmus obliquus TaxID=3088 RepID=A0A383WCH8_TETOB|eukprot:jgi/Sobl393_1/10698/SZX74734.1
MALNELDAPTWRVLALLLPDPSSFASCCKRASQSVRDEGFCYAWFAAHHRSRAPDRPWQYAALTWQLHRHASPEQVAAFMLSFHAWQKQQDNNAAGLADKAAPAATASSNPAALSAEAAAARRAAARARTMLQPLYSHTEGYFSLPMACKLLPSTVRRAQQLLANGRAVDALFYLCPASTSVLCAYAAKSRNVGLLQQLLTHKVNLRSCIVFPSHWFTGCADGIYLRTELACSYAALASGNQQMLRQVLLCAGRTWNKKMWCSRLLLCYAARHSSAECLQEVLAARRMHEIFRREAALVAPQHLVMAAARTDPWAAGAVSQLLQALTPKQRKPANMRPAYKAACSSGCMAVLQLLLGEAAAAPRQQLPVLLEAAAEAGNLQVWHQLLLQGDSDAKQQQQQLQGEEQQQQEAAAAAALPPLDWSCLSLQQLTSVLHLALPRRYGDAGFHPGTSQQQQWDAAEDACRLQMADLLWQQLVVQQGKEADLRQHLREPVATKHSPAGFGSGPAAAAVAAAVAAGEFVLPADAINSRLLFCYGAGSFSKDSFNWRAMPAARVMWLQQHQLVPPEQQHLKICASFALQGAMEVAIEAGDFTQAMQLYNVSNSVDGLQEMFVERDKRVVGSSIGGHLRRACAAGDAAAVAQLERLVCFANGLIVDMSQALQHPELLQSLLGGFIGRAVTKGTLAEELGLPWPLLQRLLTQRMDCLLAGGLGMPWFQHMQRDELLEAVQHTLTLAQDQAATAKQLHFAARTALVTEMQSRQQDGGMGAAGNAAAGFLFPAVVQQQQQQQLQQQLQQQQEQQQQPLDPMQQLANQLNAGLQLQNQVQDQANEALQELQQIVQELQQAGAPEDEIAQIEAQGLLNIQFEQPQEQQQPEVLPQEDDSNAAVLRQLQARLEAGERSIAVPQQAQLGPLPLWQQCLLEVASNMPRVPISIAPNGLDAYLTSGMLVADPPAAAGDDAGDITPLQQLLGDAALVTGPPVTPQPPRLPWGRLVAQAAVELRRPQLLAWALQPEQRQRLWGSADNAAKAALVHLGQQHCTPISNDVSRQPEQQRADLLQLQTHQQQLLPGRPAFAQLAAETALLLLNVTPNDEGLLSDWLQHGLRPGSSAADLARARAVLAAVVATKQLPAGAQLMRRLCLLQVQRLGDADLLALVVLWGQRLPPQPMRGDHVQSDDDAE